MKSLKLSYLESWFLDCFQDKYESLEIEEKTEYYNVYSSEDFRNDFDSDSEDYFEMSSAGMNDHNLQEAILFDVNFDKVFYAYILFIKEEEFELYSSDKHNISIDLYHKNQMVLDELLLELKKQM